MIGALIANYTHVGFRKKVVLFLMTIPLMTIGLTVRNLVIFGFALAGKDEWVWRGYDWYEMLLFLGVVAGLFLVGRMMNFFLERQGGEESIVQN